MNYIQKDPIPLGIAAGQRTRDVSRDFEEDDGPNLLEYWRLVRRHWFSILVLGVAGLLLAMWYASTLVPRYSSSVTVVIDTSRNAVTGVGDSYSYYYAAQMFYQTQQTVLASRELSERAASRLDAFERDRLLAPPESGLLEDLTTRFVDEIQGFLRPRSTANPVSITQAGELPGRLTRAGAVVHGGKQIVPSRDNSQILTVSFTSHDRELAAVVANALADAYIDYTNESRATLSEQSGRWLAQQVERMRDKLTESQNALQAFQVREGLLNLENVQSLASARLQQLNVKLAEARKNYDELSKRYGPKHPRLIRAETELESATAALSEESRSIVLDTDKRFELSKLENDVKSNQEVYELYLSRFRKMDVTTNESISPVYILDRAQVPGGPVFPNKQRISTIGFMGGLFIGALLAWLREKLDNTFHTPIQVEQELGLPTLGAVPLIGRDESRGVGRKRGRKGRSSGDHSLERLYSHNSKSPFAESINHIRTGILYSNAERVPKTILITSAVQSEGKTTLAINLALALSQLGRTLLIDADLRKPRVHQITKERRNAGGMVDLLIGRASAEDVLIADNDERTLMILKSGVIPPNPQEMLSSRKFDEMLESFERRFDHIVIDCAPVVPVSDALVLSSKVDAMLLLVKANSTPIEMVRDANKRLHAVKAPVVGTVLSQFDHRQHSYFGRYAYYSKYYSYAYNRKA